MVRVLTTALLIFAFILVPTQISPASEVETKLPDGPDVIVESHARERARLRVMAWRTAERYGRDSIGFELNPAYCEIIRRRLAAVQQRMEFA